VAIADNEEENNYYSKHTNPALISVPAYLPEHHFMHSVKAYLTQHNHIHSVPAYLPEYHCTHVCPVIFCTYHENFEEKISNFFV
jgi:hypothetical protein